MHKVLWKTFEKDRTEEQKVSSLSRLVIHNSLNIKKAQSLTTSVSASLNLDCRLLSLLLPTHNKVTSATCKYMKTGLFSQSMALQTKVLLGLSKEPSFAAHSETGYIFRVCLTFVSHYAKNY